MLSKKFYAYPGKDKGSLEITDDKIICEECNFLVNRDDEKKEKQAISITVLMHQKKYDDALKLLESFFDNHSEADWYTKGNLLNNLGKNEDALDCYDEALFIDTHYVKSWYRKGAILFEHAFFFQAARCFENVIELERNSKEDGWSNAAGFNLLYCYLLCKKDIESEGKISEEMDYELKSSLYEFVRKKIGELRSYYATNVFVNYSVSPPDALRLPIAVIENNESLIDWMEESFIEVLNKLEPSIVLEARILEKNID